MNQSPYRWVIVGAGALMGCVAIGAMFSLAVFLQPMSAETGWSRAGISSAMTIGFLTMGVGGFFWGSISDRYGARICALIGSMVLGLALTLASRVTTLIQFQLLFGFLIGLSVSTFFAPMIALTMRWFSTQRSLAVSLVSTGVGIAPMTISPIARWLVSAYDWRTAMLIIGIGAWCLAIPAALLVRSPPAAAAATGGPAPGVAMADGGELTAARAFRSPQFIVLALTFFCCCGAHSGPIFHTVSYAIGCGIAPMAAVTIYSLEGLSGLGGRLLLGVAADKFGVKPVLVTGLLVQSIAIAAYLAANQLATFYVVAAVFGAAYSGVMPLYSVLAREYFGTRVLGTILGAATMLSSLGMAAGPLAGGWLFDTFNSYQWLYIGSAAVALGATSIALFFPPQPSRMRPATMAAA
jgi:MFS family permease